MKNKSICWVTPIAYIDTDIYIIPYLVNKYTLYWYIIIPYNGKLDYENQINELKNKYNNLFISIISFKNRNRSIKLLIENYVFLSSIKNKFDLYYCPGGFPYFSLLLYYILGTKRVIMPIHNVKTPKGGSNYYVTKWYTQFCVNHFKHFHTFSESQYKLLCSITNGKNIMYAPFALKDYGFATNKRVNPIITFTNFGNIRKYKRIDVLIRAAQYAYEETGKTFKILIAGDCKNWDEYNQIIKYPFLFDVRIGRIDNDDIPNIFEESDYFVAPYQDIAQSGSMIVAINYEKPIIASKLEAFEEYIEDGKTGYFINTADVDELKSKLVFLINNHSRVYPLLIKNVKQLKIDKFNIENIVEKYCAFFDSIIVNG